MTSLLDGLRADETGFAAVDLPRPQARCSTARAVLGALRRSDLLLTLGRPQDALASVLRPLGRPPRDPDLLARLRIARGLALWQSGPPAPARLQIVKAWKRAAFDLTRARALEALAIVANGDQDWDEAHPAIQEAIALYRRCGHPALARALQCQAQIWRESGDLDRALQAQDEAVEAARRTTPPALVEALTYRATLLTIAGRLADARADLTGAWPQDVPAPVRARFHVAHAMLDLTQGDLAAARSALADAEAAVAQGSDVRTRGEVLLLWSDVHLAENDAVPAEQQAAQALAQFRGVSDPSGECRSRIRRAHALLAAQQPEDGVREARRALKAAGERRADLRGLALITLGRACLRVSARDATAAFGEALRLTLPASFIEAARIGSAVASGADAHDPAIVRALDALEARGDRRILSYCLADLGERFPQAGTAEPLGPGSITTDPGVSCLVAAAEALQGTEPVSLRVAGALRSLRPELPWWRAALVGEGGLLLRADREDAVGLRRSDLATVLAARGRGPALVDLSASETWRRHPDCAMHGLAWALLAPAGRDLTLYMDLREGVCRPGERELGLLTQLARLLAVHLDEPADASPADEPNGLPGIIGRSPAMEALFRELERAAAGEGCVHVFGETGTGKERIAQAIHARSRRASGPWVPVNASSLSDDLFESELFGHVRGAFSGAVADRRGYVSEAEGGTLFLDEVTDLSPKAQAKLLRFVQDREYRRVGDPRLHRANVRLVTAANVRLEDSVQQGAFRQDLMYRLCQETLTLPPLRQRGDDVGRLARHFLREADPRKALPPVAPAVWSLIARYPWPGNVRELQSEMGRARTRAGDGTVRPEHLSIALTRPAVGPLHPLRQALALFERDHIARSLEANGWNRVRTAAQLGLSRQALLAKINRLGIAPPGPPSPGPRGGPAPRGPRAIPAAGN